MDSLTKEELKALSQASGGWRVSLYMNTHPAAPQNQQDPLHLKNLLKTAGDELRARGVRGVEVSRLLAPGRDLVDDGLFWRPQPGGLAVFIADDGLRVHRLPVIFEEQVSVGDRFHVKPLLPALDRGERYYVLALSQNDVRLFLGDRSGLAPVPLGDMPRSIAEALRNDGYEEHLQSRTFASGGTRVAGGKGSAIFHGSGVATPVETRYVTEYVKRVASGMREVARDPRAPFVVAAVDYLQSAYREADGYHAVTPEGVTGNPESLDSDALHARAWPLARAVFIQRGADAVRRYRSLEGTGQATTDTAEIVRSAAYGRVDSLFVAVDTVQWGVFDRDSGTVDVHDERGPSDEDLVETATAETLLNGGEVWPEDVGAPIAALLRY